jgi:hypothetical protein
MTSFELSSALSSLLTWIAVTQENTPGPLCSSPNEGAQVDELNSPNLVNRVHQKS